jgi:hypothetical protein
MYVLKGHYADDAGLLSIGTLRIESRDGKYYDAERGGQLKAERYAHVKDAVDAQITSDESVIRFHAALSECDRIGMPVTE